MNTRLQSLLSRLQQTNLQAIALNPGPTMTYLTGLNFHIMERPTVLILTRSGRAALILPELESAKLAGMDDFLQVFPYGDNANLWDIPFQQAGSALGLAQGEIGVEPTRLRFLELEYLRRALPQAGFVSAASLLASLRKCKDAEEVAKMRTAVRMAQDALQKTLPIIKPGRTEREIASVLVLNLLQAGSDSEMPFAPIVSGGLNSANPHAVPSERPLQEGDLLVIDWGAACQGYFSDLTRTFAIGQIEPEFQTIHDLVRQANAAGRAAGKPGIPAGDVDRAARAVITKGGYGPYFNHRVGHGLGMEAHEEPYMFAENTQLLEVGNSYTVEPGIYLPGRGGVRIEDDMVITPDGCESLSDFERSLIHLPV